MAKVAGFGASCCETFEYKLLNIAYNKLCPVK